MKKRRKSIDIEKIRKENKKRDRFMLFGALIGLVLSTIHFILKKNLLVASTILLAFPILSYLYFYFKKRLDESTRIKNMELVFPDFLQLMSSNLRAGITVDRSMLLSVRKEFAPLDKEIQRTGGDITTGKEVEVALADMSKRIGSDKIDKTIQLILSGMRAGGNIANILEDTSASMREREFVEKRASSNVLMYVIFIFIAVSVGAPLLFSLSSLLVDTLTNLLSGLPTMDSASQANMPFTLSSITISVNFIKYFSIAFIVATDIMAAFVLGLVNKGEEKQGLRFLPALLIISLSVFFIVRLALSGFMEGLIG